MKLKPVNVVINNFQSIDHLDMEICGFTAISGSTNAGKSAIVRAISSAILNNPVGGMVRKGASFCSVELSSEDWGFKWEKNDKGVNRAWIRGKDTPLDKLGQIQVPEITQMGFSSIEVGDDEIQPWLAPQFQKGGCGPLFLLDQSGPRITDFLSKVSKLNMLQDAIVLAAQGKRSSNDKAKAKTEEIADIKIKLDKIIALDNLEKLNKDIDGQILSIEEYEHKIQIGEMIIAKRREAEKIITVIENVENISIPENDCTESINKVKTVFSYVSNLETCAGQIRKIKGISGIKVPEVDFNISHLSNLSKFALKIELLKQSIGILSASIKPINNSIEIEKLRQLAAFKKQIDTLSADISDLENQKIANDNEIKIVEDELSNIPSCPTCKQPWDKNHRKHKAS